MTSQPGSSPLNSPDNRVTADAELEWLLCLASAFQATHVPQKSEASGERPVVWFGSADLEAEKQTSPPLWREAFWRLGLLPHPGVQSKKRDAA